MKDKTKLLFVCLGNICRSPAAEGIMQSLLAKQPLKNRSIEIDSAGLYGGHAGDLPDARMRTHAARRGYHLTSRSRAVRPSDFEEFDLILAMDDRNLQELKQLAPDIPSMEKIHRMVNFSIHPTLDHVPDPYYSGADGFEQVLDMLEDACLGLYEYLQKTPLR